MRRSGCPGVCTKPGTYNKQVPLYLRMYCVIWIGKVLLIERTVQFKSTMLSIQTACEISK